MKHFIVIFCLFVAAAVVFGVVFWGIAALTVVGTSRAVNSSGCSGYYACYPEVVGYMRFTAGKSHDPHSNVYNNVHHDDTATHIALMRCPVVLNNVLTEPNVQNIRQIKEQKYPAAFLAYHLEIAQNGEIVQVSLSDSLRLEHKDKAAIINAVMKAYDEYHQKNKIGAGEVSVLYHAHAAEE